MELPEKINNVVKFFSALPGVGEKTALRQTLVMTNWSKEQLHLFSESLDELSQINKCGECGFFTDTSTCSICASERRNNSSVLCVVESVSDLLAIEKSERYQGVYHVLGGVLNPLLGIGPAELNLEQIKKRVIEKGIKNVILAINPSVEGDATSSYIRDLLPEDVEVDRIGFGIPMGGSLEYLDSMTIVKALENRKKML